MINKTSENDWLCEAGLAACPQPGAYWAARDTQLTAPSPCWINYERVHCQVGYSAVQRS